MTPYSSTLAWKIPWTEEPGGLPSMGSHRVGHDWSDLAAADLLVMYGCESWSRKKAERKRIMLLNCGAGENSWVLELQGDQTKSWRKSTLNSSLEGQMLKLKLQYPGHLMRRAVSLEKWKRDLWWERRAGGEGATEDEMVGWHHWLNGHEFEKPPGIVEDRWAWRVIVHEVTESRTRLGDWTTTMMDSLALFASYNLHIVKIHFLTKYRSFTEITGHTAQFYLCIVQESSQ